MKNRWVKGILSVIGAVFFSTLGIYASDTLRGVESGIYQRATVTNSTACAKGMVPIKVQGTVLCVDLYEASPSIKCPHKLLTNIVQSEENAKTPECFAVSIEGVTPWNYVSLPQAQRMCAHAGKRLPTSEEWYHIALGTHSEGCVIDKTSVHKTGTEQCVSGIGAYDLIGNVWEWVDAEVVGYLYNNRTLPMEGYVTSVDAYGIAVTSEDSPDPLYEADYFWSKSEGVFGMIRGGFYGSGSDAGLYAVNASVPTTFATQGVGFRCVKDIL